MSSRRPPSRDGRSWSRRPAASPAALRLAGAREALAARDLPLDPDLVLPAEEWHRTDGAAAVRRLLGRGTTFDALFCLNDLLALGALQALREAGVRVPEDVSLVGF